MQKNKSRIKKQDCKKQCMKLWFQKSLIILEAYIFQNHSSTSEMMKFGKVLDSLGGKKGIYADLPHKIEGCESEQEAELFESDDVELQEFDVNFWDLLKHVLWAIVLNQLVLVDVFPPSFQNDKPENLVKNTTYFLLLTLPLFQASDSLLENYARFFGAIKVGIQLVQNVRLTIFLGRLYLLKRVFYSTIPHVGLPVFSFELEWIESWLGRSLRKSVGSILLLRGEEELQFWEGVDLMVGQIVIRIVTINVVIIASIICISKGGVHVLRKVDWDHCKWSYQY